MNLPAVRQALADALLANLDTELQVSPYMLANPTPPAAHIIAGPVDYDQAMQRGADLWTMTIQVFVPLASDIGSQALLDSLVAPDGGTSVKTAVEADPTLDGLVDYVRVTAASPPRVFALEGHGPVISVDFTLEVMATGSDAAGEYTG